MLRINTTSISNDSSTTVEATEDITFRINELLDKGNHPEAYLLLQQLTKQKNQPASVYVIAGIVALQLEEQIEAAAYFQDALRVDPDHFDAGYNTALLNMMNSEWDEALKRLRHLRKLQPENASILNDLAVIWNEKKHPGRALASYSRAMKLDSESSSIRNNAMELCLQNSFIEQGLKLLKRQQNSLPEKAAAQVEINRWIQILEEAHETKQNDTPTQTLEESCVSDIKVKGIRIACFASQPTFIRDVMADFATHNEVRYFNGETVNQMHELLEWADIAWFEWCDNYLIEATKLPKTCKIICRLHSYEAFTDMPSRVDWSKVDHLIFVNHSVREIFKQQITANISMSVVYNGVDLEKFTIPKDKTRSKKIASVGYINYKKNPALLLYCFKKIYKYDSNYSLHIAGSHQDSRIQLYIDHFLKLNPLPVYFDNWIEDMPAWYADKGYVISTSLFESFHYSIAEGMASGLMPLIHNWYGADYLYPREYLFNDPDDCLRLLKELELADQKDKRNASRQYISKRFNQKDKNAELGKLLKNLIPEHVNELVKG